MAVQSSILVPAGDAVLTATLGATSSSAELTLGTNRIFSIVATADVNVKFGNTGMGAASANDYRIPANQQTTFDTSDQWSRIRVFSTAGGTYHIQFLSRS